MQLAKNAATQAHMIGALVHLALLIMCVQVTHVSTTPALLATIMLMDCIAMNSYAQPVKTATQEIAHQVFACHLAMGTHAITRLNIASTIMTAHTVLEFAPLANV